MHKITVFIVMQTKKNSEDKGCRTMWAALKTPMGHGTGVIQLIVKTKEN